MKTRAKYLTVCLAAAGSVMAGCSDVEGEQIGSETSCREFLQEPRDVQNAAIARVSDELGAGGALTPLGRPNIDFLCANDQDRTLGDVVESTG